MGRDLAPAANRDFLTLAILPVFTPEECEAIVASADPAAWRSARVSRADDPYGAIDPSARSVLSQPLPIEPSGWPAARLVDAIAQANATRWRYDLWGFDATDHPSILRYEGQVNDHFRPHLDAGEHAPTRKLSFSVQLSDPTTYRGGDLVFSGNHPPDARAQGTMTVFPSIVLHEVTPVYAGVRTAIVGWIHGPTFR